MAQKNYKNLLQKRETNSCRKTESFKQKQGDDEQCLQVANYYTVKFWRLRKFSQPGKFLGKILLPSPALESPQQHKTKNY